jgi:hypothetical protein
MTTKTGGRAEIGGLRRRRGDVMASERLDEPTAIFLVRVVGKDVRLPPPECNEMG